LELNETKDPSVQEKPHGDMRLPMNRTRSGNLINIVAFGKLAEFKCDLLQNGQYLRIEGELKQRHWQTPEGKNRTRTEVIATDLRTLEEANRTMDLHERGEEG
jgi:single-stranded DNA-binding protein